MDNDDWIVVISDDEHNHICAVHGIISEPSSSSKTSSSINSPLRSSHEQLADTILISDLSSYHVSSKQTITNVDTSKQSQDETQKSFKYNLTFIQKVLLWALFVNVLAFYLLT